MAVATAEPYASHLHFAPEDNHVKNQSDFYGPEALPDTQPTESKDWRDYFNNKEGNYKVSWSICNKIYNLILSNVILRNNNFHRQQSTSQYNMYKHSLTFSFGGYTFAVYTICNVCCHETDGQIWKLFQGAQLEGTPKHSQSYSEICAIEYKCIAGTKNRQTDRHWWPQYILHCNA